MTVFLWGIQQRRFEIKAIHSYTKMHLAHWFPKLPSYQAFDRRLGELAPAFSLLVERLITQRKPGDTDMNMLLMDSMPILLAKGKRSGHAKVARELCDQTYNAFRKQWYYGMKLHIVGIKRHQTLPFPALIFASEVSPHDLSIDKQMLEHQPFYGFSLIGDKVYSDADRKADLLHKDIHLLTPTKLKRGQPASLPGGDAWDTAISRARQPVESFFHWLHQKTGIQIASKVRSLKGLLLPIFGRIAAAIFSLRFDP